MLSNVDVILHRPQSSENIGAVARAMKNFGLKRLVLVSPKRYEPARAETLAVHSEEILQDASIALTLEEAIAPYLLVIPTTERAIEGRPGPVSPRQAARLLVDKAQQGKVALLFGAEATGVSNDLLSRFLVYSSIPSHPERKSLNLAQAVLLYGWELFQEAGEAQMPTRPDEPRRSDEPASMQLVSLVRERARRLLLQAGFLNKQQPDRALDEMIRVLQRCAPTRRELEMLLAALSQLERTSVFKAP